MNLTSQHSKTALEILKLYQKAGLAKNPYSGLIPVRKENLSILQFKDNKLIGMIVVPDKDYANFVKMIMRVNKIEEPKSE